MEEKHKNFKDFIRKRLNEIEKSDDNWDKPSPDIWANAQKEIPSYPPSRRGIPSFIWKFLALALLIIFGGLSWSLNREVTSLKGALDVNEIDLRDAHSKIQEIEKNMVDEKMLLKKENQGLKASNEKLAQKISELEGSIQLQRNRNLILDNDIEKKEGTIQLLQNEILGIVAISTNQLDDKKTRARVDSFTKIKELNIYPLGISKALASPEFVYREIIETDVNRTKFEIGYGVSRFEFQSFINVESKDKKKPLGNAQTTSTYSPAHNFNLAYSPVKNWWIRSGINFTAISDEQTLKVAAVYDKTTEYMKPGGETGNSLNVQTTSAYAQSESDIRVELPPDIKLESGDFLYTELTTLQNFDLLQIPLGLEYRHGENRLQWQVQSGVIWNRMSFGDYLLSVKVEAKNQELPVEEVKIVSKPQEAKHFLEWYGGLGLRYSITGRWGLRTDLLIRRDEGLTNQEYRIGIGFQF